MPGGKGQVLEGEGVVRLCFEETGEGGNDCKRAVNYNIEGGRRGGGRGAHRKGTRGNEEKERAV